MKIELTPELEELRAEVRRFTERELGPLARVIDSSGEGTSEVHRMIISRKLLK